MANNQSRHKPYLRTKTWHRQRNTTCGICGRSGLSGDEGLRNHRRFNKTCSDIMDQIRAARRPVKAPSNKESATAKPEVESHSLQDGLASLMIESEEGDDDQEDNNRHHLWIIMQVVMTSFYMYFIYAYKM
ncbi:hypothetical protein MBANPS3_008599 [Mucor bainieri]